MKMYPLGNGWKRHDCLIITKKTMLNIRPENTLNDDDNCHLNFYF